MRIQNTATCEAEVQLAQLRESRQLARAGVADVRIGEIQKAAERSSASSTLAPDAGAAGCRGVIWSQFLPATFSFLKVTVTVILGLDCRHVSVFDRTVFPSIVVVFEALP